MRPVVEQGVAVVDLELAVLHPVQQHVHARQVVGGDVLFLPVDHADAVRPHLLAHVQQQRAGAAGEVQHAIQLFLFAGGGVLAVQVTISKGWWISLRGVELARLLAGTGGKLADQVFVGVAQDIAVGGELRRCPRRSSADDGAELGVALGRVLPSFSELRLISENRPSSSANS
jgi:hypothetical protein